MRERLPQGRDEEGSPACEGVKPGRRYAQHAREKFRFYCKILALAAFMRAKLFLKGPCVDSLLLLLPRRRGPAQSAGKASFWPSAQGLISSWHDRQITAGTELGEAIDSHLDAADVVLLLISPDFIASDYCYEEEMKRALERHRKGETRVIPVILRPCDWHGLPFGKLLATPTDGRPITKWPNIDEAFLDVVISIKRALKDLGLKPKLKPETRIRTPSRGPGSSFREPARSSNLRIKKKFTDLDRDRFRHDGFEYIANFFENSLKELASRNTGVDQTFRRIDVIGLVRRHTGKEKRSARGRPRSREGPWVTAVLNIP